MRDLKPEKIRDMTEDEILMKIREIKEELFHLRFRNQMRQLQNPLLLREKKRDIARLNTILAEHKSGIRLLGAAGEAQAAGAPARSAAADAGAAGATPGARTAPAKGTAKGKKTARKGAARPAASRGKARTAARAKAPKKANRKKGS